MLIEPKAIFEWTETLGYLGLALVVFVESGVFFGFVLPGDSLLFAAGLLAAKGYFDIYLLLLVLSVSGIVGYFFGYWFGERLGGWLEHKRETVFYRKRHLELARQFYEKHGGKAVMFARVIPIVRTFVPIISGMVPMPYARFALYNIIGGLLWAGTFGLGGYFLGVKFPSLIDIIIPIAFGIIILSLLPGVYAMIKNRWLANRSKEN